MPNAATALSPADRQTMLELLARAAKEAGHIWPDYAACEAVLESAWLTSDLARHSNNLFGAKQHRHPVYDTVALPTRECLNGEWVTEHDSFVTYPDWTASFQDRMATLRRLSTFYPHYQLAVSAVSGESFIKNVSLTWSTDPHRAANVLAIYRAHFTTPPSPEYA